ncbi:MAG: hypothetical protein WA324_26420 [Bryobacteraceae bacterium]
METFKQATVVLRLAEALKARGSWAGETHVQKAVYFLQELLGVPTGFEFILYKHGPFSFDLRATLTFMEAEDLIAWQPRNPYGPTLVKGADASYLDQKFGDIANRYQEQINFVAERLADKSVRELEKLATALYVTKDQNIEGISRSRQIVALKPHIPIAEANAAVQLIDELMQARNSLSSLA